MKNITKEDFLTIIKNNLQEEYGEQTGITIKVDSILKNNNTKFDAIIISQENSNISPTIYVNDLYEKYINKDLDINEITKEIFSIYISSKIDSNFKIENFEKFDDVRGKLFYKIINYEMNKELLKDVPHKKFLDLCVVVYYMFSDISDDKQAITLIKNSHIDMWNVSCNVLLDEAFKNTPKLFPAEIKNMDVVIKELILLEKTNNNFKNMIKEEQEHYNNLADNEFNELSANREYYVPMYVLSNSIRINGAACMLYPNVLKEFANKINSDVYILPSSIHELILVPGNEDLKKSELNAMVREVNRDAVKEDEILSDHIYIYSLEKDAFDIA